MSRFVRNPLFAGELQRSPRYGAALEAHAQVVAASVRRLAPAELKGSVATEHDGAGARVSVNSPFWHLFEYGVPSKNLPPFSMLRRGARSAGLTLHEQ